MLLIATGASARDDVLLRKGQVVPFDGVLMSHENYASCYECSLERDMMDEKYKQLYANKPDSSFESMGYGFVGGVVFSVIVYGIVSAAK